MFISTTEHEGVLTSPSLAELEASISALASGLDARFVEAGSALGNAYGMIEKLVASLEGITNALDREAAEAAVESMRATADRLTQLPLMQVRRKQDLATIRDAGDTLRGQITQIQKLLRFLHICGHNIKIAAAGAEEFSGFADSMVHRLDLGERQLASFEAEIEELAGRIADVVVADRMLAAECTKVIPQVPMKLAADAVALQAHQADLALLAQRTADVARDLRNKVGAALGAMQIGDITRQRLEHVASGLQALCHFIDADAAEDVSAVKGHILALLAAQASDTIADFRREAQVLADSLRGIGPDAERLLALQSSGNDARQNDSQSFLAMLESGIAEVQAVTGKLREADRHSDSLGNATSQTVERLEQRLQAVSKVQSDVQQMAWNTGLRCMRMEQQDGRALAVISSEIRAFANSLEGLSARIRQTFEQLSDAALSLHGENGAGNGDAGSTLTESLACIRIAGQKMEESLNGLEGDASDVIAILRETTETVDCEAEISTALTEAADHLDGMASFATDIPQAATPLLADIARTYTMARERDVHRRFASGDADDVVADIASTDDDDDDDGLF